LACYPAIDVEGALDDLTLAVLDDFEPSAVEERAEGARIFFAAARQRDDACAALAAKGLFVTRLDVDDEDWARRSQQNLRPVTVGRITVVPRPAASLPHTQPRAARLRSRANPATGGDDRVSVESVAAASLKPLTIVIEPSMGFGTGHHATTRFCLAALQRTNLTGAFVLDVGTGSGILAIAAARLGATGALGIDVDADAIRSANENLALNPDATGIRFAVADLTAMPLPRADVVTANLTGALLTRVVSLLRDALTPGGTLVLSGILAAEEQAVRRAFSAADDVWRQQDGEWIGLMLTPASCTVKRS
jgi:ribosomal protein L11 methylase PrmA